MPAQLCTREDFVRMWQKHKGNAKAVAEHFGMQPTSVSVKASQLRKLGIPLCKGQSGGRGGKITQAEIDRLAALITVAEAPAEAVTDIEAPVAENV